MTVTGICFALLCAAMLLAFVRLVRGPSVADRVVALDLLAIICVGAIIVYGVATDLPVFLDAAIVLAMVGFAGTIAFAKYLERRGRSQ